MKSFGTGIKHCDLQTLFESGAVGGLPDGQLLERFIAHGDELAFEVLVRRHGPLVWGVCFRILRDHHDAEDAFQATFLVLARKASTIIPRTMLPNWLYGVAHRIALKAKLMAAKRGLRERVVTELPEPEAVPPPVENDLHDALDQELSRLPDYYRTPIILCHLEGKGHKEAAEQLGWPIGTLSGRLSRARVMLVKRLSRRGLALSAGSLAVLSTRHTASAFVPISLVNATVKAVGVSTAVPAAMGLFSAEVAAMAEGVMKAMLWTKVKTGLLLVIGAAIGIGLIAYSAEAPRRIQAVGRPGTQKRSGEQKRRFNAEGSRKLLQELDWALTKVDTDKSRISALSRWTFNSMSNDQFANSSLQTGLHLSFGDLPVAKDAEILIDGKPAKLTDLKIDRETYGLQMTLRLSEDDATIMRIDARSQNSYFFLKGVDVTKRIITVGIGASGLLAGQDDLPVAEDAKILISTGKSRAQEGRFTDLKAGMRISFELATKDGQIVVRGIKAQE